MVCLNDTSPTWLGPGLNTALHWIGMRLNMHDAIITISAFIFIYSVIYEMKKRKICHCWRSRWELLDVLKDNRIWKRTWRRRRKRDGGGRSETVGREKEGRHIGEEYDKRNVGWGAEEKKNIRSRKEEPELKGELQNKTKEKMDRREGINGGGVKSVGWIE
jgi:hypothetical protein